MIFQLTEEQRMIQMTVREFARKEIEPMAGKCDRESLFPEETISKMAEMGLLGMMVPTEYGGAGLDTVSYSLAMQEIAYACAATSVIMGVNNLVCEPLLKFGTEVQKQKYLVPLAQGKFIGSFALTEPGAGSDAANQKTSALLKDNFYILNGTKMFITSGSHAKVFITTAVTDKTARHHGISAFIVEKGMPGFSIGKVEDKMGLRASDTTELIFENCRVPSENLLGKEGEGFKIMMTALDGGRIGIASQSVGIAQACLDAATRYAKKREAFGQPIAEFQGIRWMIADMATEIEAARLLTLQAALLKDRGLPFTKEASMAKLFASEMVNRVAYKALQIHGGYGYLKDFPVERYYRDARVTTIYEGTSEIQRNVIAKLILSTEQ
ncbi:MAG TPA: acyl-CoA dehydrogenase [Candidatus Limnocylindrales bacterium]|nr:acyl-CoA dehydrogenase [Candidatus Limnocylindrales bacterium]